MSDYQKNVRIYVSSPTEVEKERAALVDVVTELNDTWGNKFGIRLECVGKDHCLKPQKGKPQKKSAGLSGKKERWDIFIGILWTRFGPSGTGAGFGTQEEFEDFIKMSNANPRQNKVLFYFKDYPLPPSKIDPEQLIRINQIKKLIHKRRGLFYSYYDRDEFVSRVKRHLLQRLHSWKGKTTVQGIRNDAIKKIHHQNKFLLPVSHALYRLFNACSDLEEYSLRLTRLLCHYFHAETSKVIILKAHEKETKFVAGYNGKFNIMLKKEEKINKAMAETPFVIHGDVINESGLLGYPLILDKVVGYILLNKNSPKTCFTKSDESLLAFIAEQAAIAVNKFQLKELHYGKIQTP